MNFKILGTALLMSTSALTSCGSKASKQAQKVIQTAAVDSAYFNGKKIALKAETLDSLVNVYKESTEKLMSIAKNSKNPERQKLFETANNSLNTEFGLIMARNHVQRASMPEYYAKKDSLMDVATKWLDKATKATDHVYK